MPLGRFITLEGGEGAGKSTQTRLLADALIELGLPVLRTREPGGAPGAELLRDLLLGGSVDWSATAETLLHFAARAEHVEKTIRPALAAGMWVISDRFFDSTMAYQGYGHGVSLDRIREVTQLACEDVIPDRTFLLDIPVHIGLGRSGWRAQSKWDRFEVLDPAFHERVREGYLRLAAAEPKRWQVIDAARDEASIAQDVRREVDAFLGLPASLRP